MTQTNTPNGEPSQVRKCRISDPWIYVDGETNSERVLPFRHCQHETGLLCITQRIWRFEKNLCGGDCSGERRKRFTEIIFPSDRSRTDDRIRSNLSFSVPIVFVLFN